MEYDVRNQRDPEPLESVALFAGLLRDLLDPQGAERLESECVIPAVATYLKVIRSGAHRVRGGEMVSDAAGRAWADVLGVAQAPCAIHEREVLRLIEVYLDSTLLPWLRSHGHAVAR